MTTLPLILIVDDDERFREILSVKLQAEGFKVQTVESGEHCLAVVKDLKPGLILMDMKMPGMNGAEALLKLQADPETKNIKVIFLSSFGDPQPDRQEVNNRFSQELDALAYFKKVDDLDSLVSKIKAIVQ